VLVAKKGSAIILIIKENFFIKIKRLGIEKQGGLKQLINL
jgi:hypothetical protein